jgi:alpha-L-fucosidase
MKTAIPTPRQLEFQEWELGLFIHFLGGYYRPLWRGNPKPPPGDPRCDIDCESWIRPAAEAGFKYAVYTAKHHEGFCMWPSALSRDFSIQTVPWKGGKGDVVGDYVAACRKHGLAVGIYYSPYDHHVPYYASDPKRYDDYMIGHMKELLGNYGKIDLLWFDGYLSEGHTYDWPRIVDEIRKLQPDILMFNMGDPSYRWVGNESGIAPVPCWNTVEEVPFSMMHSEQVEKVKQPMWLPAECDMRIRYEGWSWRGPQDPIKSVEELMGLYYVSVGRGCNMLLNIGPEWDGRANVDDARRLVEFGQEIRRRFGEPLCRLADCKAEGGRYEYTPPVPALVDHAVIMEDLTRGEHVRRFAIKMLPAPEPTRPYTLFEGQNIGHKVICRFPMIKASKVWLEILESDGPATIRDVQFHNSTGAV